MYSSRVQLKCDGTRCRTGWEMKGKLANGVGSQCSSHYLRTWCIQHYYRWRAQLGCQQSTELTPPADLNGLVRFAERRNLVSAGVPSHFNWPLDLWGVGGCGFCWSSLFVECKVTRRPCIVCFRFNGVIRWPVGVRLVKFCIMSMAMYVVFAFHAMRACGWSRSVTQLFLLFPFWQLMDQCHISHAC